MKLETWLWLLPVVVFLFVLARLLWMCRAYLRDHLNPRKNLELRAWLAVRYPKLWDPELVKRGEGADAIATFYLFTPFAEMWLQVGRLLFGVDEVFIRRIVNTTRDQLDRDRDKNHGGNDM